MANIISGKIIALDEQARDVGKQGNPFYKREFVLQALRFNPNDGSPELSEYNTPLIELNGIDNCKMLDQFKVGDVVKVSFSLEGRKVTNNEGKVRYFNSARAYAIEKLNVKLGNADGAAGTVAGQQASAQPTPEYTNFGQNQDELPF